MPSLSILLATHNGGDILRRTLQGYVALGKSEISFEIIVVNNNSTDGITEDIIASFQSTLPLKSINEPVPGKNKALNTGLALVESDIVILTDDDAIPSSGFFESWLDVFKRHPDSHVFGGSITPIFDSKIASWMLKYRPKFEELYAQRLDVVEGPVSSTQIYGPNMAVRKSIFDDGMRFNEEIGPNGTQADYPMGSETEFCQRAEANDYKLVFCPQPMVSHIVRPHQVTTDFIQGRAFRLGRGTARRQWLAGVLSKSKAGWLKKALRSANNWQKRFFKQLATLRQNPYKRFCAQWDLNFLRGYQEEIRALRAQEDENTAHQSRS